MACIYFVVLGDKTLTSFSTLNKCFDLSFVSIYIISSFFKKAEGNLAKCVCWNLVGPDPKRCLKHLHDGF